MANRDIIIRILGQDQATPTLNRVGLNLRKISEIALGAFGGDILGTFTRGLFDAIRGLRAFTAESIAAAGEQEAAEIALSTALRNTGQAVGEVLPQLQKQASALQALTGVGDEVILRYQSLLVSVGKLRGEGLERATKASLDLAAALDVDQRTAFDLVARAAAGYTSTLSRYGIILDDSIPKSEKFEAALGFIEERFGGAAQDKLQSYSQRLVALQGDFGDFQEVVGGPLRDVISEFTGTVLSPLIKQVTSASEETGLWRDTTLDIAIALAELGGVGEKAARPLVFIAGVLAINEAQKFATDLSIVTAAFKALNPTLDSSGTKLGELAERLWKLRAGETEGGGSGTPPGGGIVDDLNDTADDAAAAARRAEREAQRVQAQLRSIETDLLRTGNVTEAQAARIAASIEERFQLAADAGAEPSAILRALEGDLEALVDAAERAGVALPEAIRAMGTELDRLNELRAMVISPVIEAPADFPTPELDPTTLDFELPDDVIGEIERPIQELSDRIADDLGQAGRRGATEMVDSLVDAAAGADVAWSRFFSNLLKSIAKAIAQLLIFRAIAIAIPGVGSFLGFKQGGVVEAAQGAVIPGYSQGGPVSRALAGETLRSGSIATYQAGGRAGPTARLLGGAGGIDSQLGLFTPGELVVDTTRQQAESVLAGRAAIVPADRVGQLRGGADGPPIQITINALDGESVRRVIESNPREFAEGLRFVADRGF